MNLIVFVGFLPSLIWDVDLKTLQRLPTLKTSGVEVTWLREVDPDWLDKQPFPAFVGNGPGLKMYFLLKMGIFHCYVSLPEGKCEKT